jgi:hypothetical protein
MKRDHVLNFGCSSPKLLLAALVLGLAGCGAREAMWQRPGTADATRSKDYAYCRSEAKDLTGPALGIDQDIAASRGADWERNGQYESRLEQNTGADAHAFADALGQCMTDKGYQSR